MRDVIVGKWTDFAEAHPQPTDQRVMDWLGFIKPYCDMSKSIDYDDAKKAAWDAVEKQRSDPGSVLR